MESTNFSINNLKEISKSKKLLKKDIVWENLEFI